ncbi:hypothetical protein M2352_000125 [Azospirillum fermentarium]|uniref:hypothetical protein n=1 Tax=Azospirillum fermentarium TaxID=1233114 RepID=UPI0022269091|nr:hypothetical protein [Azospirillum fermentarium]MCW2244534.1 hypothetical protein [Azospirillum fermentarium]
MRAVHSARLFAATVLTAAGLLAAPAASASEGGGAANTCPWSQDIKVKIGKKELTISQDMLNPKAGQQVIDGYELRPNLDQLRLNILTPRGEMWEASLTLLVRGKRCAAYYVGKAFLVEDAESVIYVPNRSH